MRSTPSFRSALAHTAFRRLLLAHGLATLGQVSLTLAVGVEVLAGTGSPVWVSVTVALGFAPYVLCSGLAGVLADRCSRSSVLGCSYAARALVAAVMVAGLAADVPVAWVVLLSGVTSVLATPSYPALLAAAPQLVDRRDLPPANALVTGTENTAWIAGPGLLGVVLLTGGGPTTAAVLSVGLYVLATAVTLPVRLVRPERPVGTAHALGVLAELAEGARTVAGVARVRTGMTVAVLDNFLYGFLVVAVVLLAADGLGGERSLGWLNGALSAGAVAAMAITNRLAAHRRPEVVLAVLMAGFGGAVALLPVSGGLPVAALLLAGAGVGTMVAEVVAVTVIQRASPAGVTARVFGVYDQLNVGAIALGSAVAGPLAAVLGTSTAVAVTGLAVGALGILASRRLAVAGRAAAKVPARVPAPRSPVDLGAP
ncbi:MAG TPA: MFS transporter, partial [Jiangellales bacterium]|nr:MFS transporter [Jiangellales bacterium]